MVHGSWDVKHDGQNFLTFWTIFCPFNPKTTQKNQHFEKLKKNPGDIITLHKRTKNHYHKLYCSLGMARKGCNCYFSFWAIFCPFTSLTAQKIKISKKKKKEKNAWRYYLFTHVYQKLWLDDARFLRNGAWRTEGRTDGQKKVPHVKMKVVPK